VIDLDQDNLDQDNAPVTTAHRPSGSQAGNAGSIPVTALSHRVPGSTRSDATTMIWWLQL
jgi:hypothetical protein